MINNYKTKTIVILSVMAILSFGAYAFAGWGMGYGHHGWDSDGRGMGYDHRGWDRDGRGMHSRGWGGPGYGNMMEDLSEEQIRKLDKERDAFYKATEGLRQDIYGKEADLRDELSKENPDAIKAASIQKEISKLEAQLNQKQIDHLIAVKKINPNAGRRFNERGQRRYSSSDRGSCWR
jgi:zinc resistance-associated protein